MNKKRIIIATTLLYILLITLLSVVNLSGKIDSVGVDHFDKVVHFIFYFSMNILLILLAMLYSRSSDIRWMILSTLATILYSVGIEVVQRFVGRQFELLDILANSAGAFTALFVARQSMISLFIKRCLRIS